MLAEGFLMLLPILAAFLITTVIKNHESDLRIDCQSLRSIRYLFHQSVIAVRRDKFD